MNKLLYRTLFLGIVACGGAGGLMLSTGRTTLGILFLVLAFACGLVIVGTALGKGIAQQRGRARGVVAEAEVATPAHPASVDQVLAAIEGLNDPEYPYEVATTRTGEGVQVVARWKTEELRWQTLFTRGGRMYAWKLVVDLDPARALYRFTEYSASRASNARVGAGGLHADQSWEWQRGKTAGQLQMSVVMTADGEVSTNTPQGPRSSWEGVVSIRPSDAKLPVFTTLRNHGWRPPRDWWGARRFER